MFALGLSLLLLGSIQMAYGCNNPVVSASSYTPADAQVLSHIAFIAEFTLKCDNKESNNVNLYADVEGSLVPVIKSADGSGYQVSWTKELKHAKTGDFEVNLYDEEGYGAIKRVMERGESKSSVKPLVTIVVNYPGAYKGPILNSELLAAFMSFLVFYLAYSSKATLLA